MADSPTQLGEGVVEVEVLSNGSAISESMQVRSVTVRRGFNAIPVAIVVIEDGNMSQQSFDNSDASTFAPGAKIQISASYRQMKQPLFKGIVIKHGLKISMQNDSRLIIECKSPAAKLAIERHNVNFQKVKDSDVIEGIIETTSLAADVSATTTTYDELVQYNCSDWDYMLLRAEANGYLVNVQDDTISAGKPDTSASAALSVEYGVDLYDFSADLDAQPQRAGVSSVAWDAGNQKAINGTGSQSSLTGQGNLDQATLAKVLGNAQSCLQSDVVMEADALNDWASGQLLRAELARIRGTMTIQGSAKATTGAIIELKGVGQRFSGDVLTSGVTHRIANGNWLTEVNFGLSEETHAERFAVKAPAAAGLTAPAEGLHIGVVLKTDEDPSNGFRVQLALPVLKAEADQIWARMASFYASAGFGAYFMPEVGDEVVVGYFNNDPSHPVILGSLYSTKNAAPFVPDADNTKKAIVSKQKLTIEFDDEKKSLTFTTPGNNSIVLDDDGKSITLEDQNSNKITLDDSGITLDSPKDIVINAGGKLTADAASSLELTAKTDLKAKGMNATVSADQSLKASGQASAEISASGNTSVKGAMVMIN